MSQEKNIKQAYDEWLIKQNSDLSKLNEFRETNFYGLKNEFIDNALLEKEGNPFFYTDGLVSKITIHQNNPFLNTSILAGKTGRDFLHGDLSQIMIKFNSIKIHVNRKIRMYEEHWLISIIFSLSNAPIPTLLKNSEFIAEAQLITNLIGEEIIYWLKVLADNLIQLFFITYFYNKHQMYPEAHQLHNHDSIGKIIDAKKKKIDENFKNFFSEAQIDFLKELNEISNAYKHSYFDLNKHGHHSSYNNEGLCSISLTFITADLRNKYVDLNEFIKKFNLLISDIFSKIELWVNEMNKRYENF